LAVSAGSAKVSAEVVGYDALPGATVSGEPFVPVTAVRVASVRAVRPGSPVQVRVTGRAGVPASGVGAVVAQVSATGPVAAGSLAVYPAGKPKPPAGSVSYGKGVPSTGLVVVPPGTGGNVMLAAAGGAVGVTVDVVGYYALPGTAAGAVLMPVRAARIANTATGAGTPRGPLKAAGSRVIAVTGTGGVPVTGVAAVLLEVTSAHASAAARVTVYPAGAKRPAVTSASLARGGAATALVPVKPGTGGKVAVAISAGQADVAVDVVGYFVLDRTAPGAVTGLKVAKSTSLAVTVSWTDPADADFADVVIRQAKGSVPPATIASATAVATVRRGVTSYIFKGLSPVTTYSFSVFARDSVGNTAKAASVTMTTPSAFHTVGGTVSGLSGTVVLQVNGGSTLAVGGNGPFAFASLFKDGARYNVTVRTYPAGQACPVVNGSGAVAGVNVANVAVRCAGSASDNFARANGHLGPNWTDMADGGMAISAKAAVGGGSGVTGDIWTAASFTSDQFAQITLTSTQPTGGQWIGAAVRAQHSGQDAYVGLYSANNGSPQLMLFLRQGGGNWQQLGSYNCGPLPAGTRIGVAAVGNSVAVTENGVQRIGAGGATLTGGAPGIMAFGKAAASTWSGGNAGFRVSYQNTSSSGVQSYDVLSANDGYGPQVLRVLQPSHPASGVAHNFMIVLPVEPGLGTTYGDGLATVQALGAQDKYNLTIVEPTFKFHPWYGNSSSDPHVQYETFVTRELVPWLKQHFATTGNEQVWLLGFSKSGFGAQDLILRHPDVFTLAAGWDFPADMSSYDQYDESATNYGTNANFQANYRLTASFVQAHAAPFQHGNRIWIGGYALYQVDMSAYDQLLTAAGIAHSTETPAPAIQAWDSGWVSQALAALHQDSLNLPAG
jgi:hypothetical protein